MGVARAMFKTRREETRWARAQFEAEVESFTPNYDTAARALAASGAPAAVTLGSTLGSSRGPPNS